LRLWIVSNINNNFIIRICSFQLGLSANDVGHARVAGRVLLPGGVPSIRESLAAEQTTDKACLPADTRASLTRIPTFLASKNLANLLQGKIIIIARNAASEFLLANFSQFCFLGQLLDGLCCR
jgi:hypothetical protein